MASTCLTRSHPMFCKLKHRLGLSLKDWHVCPLVDLSAFWMGCQVKQRFAVLKVICCSSCLLSHDWTSPPSIHIITLQLSILRLCWTSTEKFASTGPTCQKKKERERRIGSWWGGWITIYSPHSKCDSLGNCHGHRKCFHNLFRVCWVRRNIFQWYAGGQGSGIWACLGPGIKL